MPIKPKQQSPQLENLIEPVAVAPAVAPLGLSLRDAAAHTGVTFWFIQTAVKTGELPARRAGKKIIILRDDLHNFMRGLPLVVQPVAAGPVVVQPVTAERSEERRAA